MRKKLIAAGVIAAMVLTGCGGGAKEATAPATEAASESETEEQVTPENLIKAANENTANVKSADMSIAVDIQANISASGMAMDIVMNMEMDMQATNDPIMMHTTGNYSFEMLGQGESGDIEMYMEQDGDKGITYSKMGDEDWKKEESDSTESILESYGKADAAAMAKSLELAANTETVNNIKCYKLTGNVAGNAVESLMGSAMGNMEEMNLLGEMNMDDMSVPVEYYISKDKSQPVKMTMDLKDIMKASLEASMKESAGAEEVTTEVSACAIEIQFNSFDTVESITIPDEVKQ